jgi:hypothetical protein
LSFPLPLQFIVVVMANAINERVARTVGPTSTRP